MNEIFFVSFRKVRHAMILRSMATADLNSKRTEQTPDHLAYVLALAVVALALHAATDTNPATNSATDTNRRAHLHAAAAADVDEAPQYNLAVLRGLVFCSLERRVRRARIRTWLQLPPALVDPPWPRTAFAAVIDAVRSIAARWPQAVHRAEAACRVACVAAAAGFCFRAASAIAVVLSAVLLSVAQAFGKVGHYLCYEDGKIMAGKTSILRPPPHPTLAGL